MVLIDQVHTDARYLRIYDMCVICVSMLSVPYDLLVTTMMLVVRTVLSSMGLRHYSDTGVGYTLRYVLSYLRIV